MAGHKHIFEYSGTNSVESTQLVPHCCPVCGGNGLRPNGFYSQATGAWATTTSAFEMCRTCSGSGMVWEVRRT